MIPISKYGRSYPLGATLMQGGVNFCVYAKDASQIEILLFDSPYAKKEKFKIALDPTCNRTGDYWHVFIENITQGQLYAYRVYGEYNPQKGFLFNPNKCLLDPYAQAVLMPKNYSRKDATGNKDNVATCLKGVVVDHRNYDWQGTSPLQKPITQTVIYEMHVRGFTASPSSNISQEKRGTYAGIIEKIPYLKDLGITAVELLPIAQFDPFDSPSNLKNYWGYSPVNFFAPHSQYSSDKSPLGAFNEFRDLVRALHKADIEVYLDVVFNHTSEGDLSGPLQSFKGFSPKDYYMLEEDKRYFSNYSGCGNTFNANSSISRRLIRDCLHFWVQTMHVDGFRFDLASILSRDKHGNVMQDPPLLKSINTDPILAGCKIIAEAWDAAGLYQVGNFTKGRWQELNGKFRDDVRGFIKGDKNKISAFSNRLIGSPDLYYDKGNTPHRSVNFITAHDGFTLNDLVSYNQKHNLANLEENQDGDNHNLSYNCGIEGETDDKKVLKFRDKQIKNFLSVLLLSLGTPLITMGDEVKRTQQGNNNAYCQDNEISWFDWDLTKENKELFEFTQNLISWRLKDPALGEQRRLSLAKVLDNTKILWHGVQPLFTDWSSDSHALAYSICDPNSKEYLYIAINSYHQDLDFKLPKAKSGSWHRIIDTADKNPYLSQTKSHSLNSKTYKVEAYSLIMLLDMNI